MPKSFPLNRRHSKIIFITLIHISISTCRKKLKIYFYFTCSDEGNLKVHFWLRFEPVRWRMSVTIEEILSAFRRLYPSTKIVPGSLHIKQITNNAFLSAKPSTLAPEISATEFYQTTPSSPRQCTPVRLNLCRSVLEYNLTSYPNHFGHKNLDDIHDDLIAFRYF